MLVKLIAPIVSSDKDKTYFPERVDKECSVVLIFKAIHDTLKMILDQIQMVYIVVWPSLDQEAVPTQ